MIINHNMNAMTAHRQMGINTGNQGKAIEKLSSGQRINRAGDDAAGLAISEKMRGQIRGLDGASSNAQDGVSLIQTAEGALNETHNILQRMRELSVQGANDTNVDADRDAITKEMEALKEEINRISTDTEFNGQKLLNGEFKDKKLQIGANQGQSVDLDIKNMNSDLLGLTENSISTEAVKPEMETVKSLDTITNVTISLNGTKLTAKDISFAVGSTLEDINKQLSDTTGLENVTANISANGTLSFVEEGNTDIKYADGTAAALADDAALDNVVTNKVDDDKIISTEEIKVGVEFNGTMHEITLEAGKTEAELEDHITAELGKIDADLVGSINTSGKLEITTTDTNDTVRVGEKLDPVSVKDHTSATKSIATLDNAINLVSSQRADLGALQNRLEHTIATNDNSAENLQAAESRIRDVDMAKEMMELSKNNVLVQAAQSMLGQANQQPNQVLSLLR